MFPGGGGEKESFFASPAAEVCDWMAEARDECPDDLCDWLEEFGSGPVTWEGGVPEDDEPDRRTFEPVPHEADVGTLDWVSIAARSLVHNGFCTLRCAGGSLVPLDVCEGCRVAADERLDKLLACARARGLNPRAQAPSERLGLQQPVRPPTALEDHPHAQNRRRAPK